MTQDRTRLIGWKAIARHLGRSERTIQSWEAERRLPVHRLAGSRGSTVYAYASQLDGWMKAGEHAYEASLPLPSRGNSLGTLTGTGADPVRASTPRKPGLLVLPFERRATVDDGWEVDAVGEDLVQRFAAQLPSLRVLSWTTAKLQRDQGRSVDQLSAALGVRYLVEGRCDVSTKALRIDVRVVDAEVDQVFFTNRFASSRLDRVSFATLVSHAIVDHFSLVLSGALVEPLHPSEVDPECYVHYLEGVRYFADGSAEYLGRARLAMDRALIVESTFAPARAMRALIRLQCLAIGQIASRDAVDEARAVSATCRADGTARVTAAFLDAAIALEFDRQLGDGDLPLARALREMPASVVQRGRLFERRSCLRVSGPALSADDHRRSTAGNGGVDALGEQVRRQPKNLVANVMFAVADAHQRRRS